MMGEYIGRLYNEAKRRPLYIVAGNRRPRRAPAKLGHVAEATANQRKPGRQRQAGRSRGARAAKIALEQRVERPAGGSLSSLSSLPVIFRRAVARRRAGTAGC